MKLKLFGKLLAVSAGGVMGATGIASAKEGVEALPAELYDCRPVGPENRIKPPPPLVPRKGPESYSATQRAFVEENKLAENPCPAGKLAYPEDPFSENPDLVAPPHPAGYDPTVVKGSGYAGSDEPDPPGYRYVSKQFNDFAHGVSIEMSIDDPEINMDAFRAHSIASIHMAGHPGSGDGVELGWRKFRYQRETRLFIFVKKDAYQTYGQPGGDCYNCHFVPYYGADYVPGQELEISSSNQDTMRMGITVFDGNWWLWVGDQWIGYVDSAFWLPDKTVYTPLHQFFGEVYDDEDSSTDMGNGEWGSSGAGSLMRDPQITRQYKDGTWQTLDQPVNPPSSSLWNSHEHLYDHWSPDPPSSQTYWKYGGPGSH